MLQLMTALLLWGSNQAWAADTGSASVTCSGRAKACPTCEEKYFYIYTYQYAHLRDGKVVTEKHSLKMRGFLGNPEEYKLIKPTSKHMLYSNGKLTLSVPFRAATDGIWLLHKREVAGPGEKQEEWVQLCSK